MTEEHTYPLHDASLNSIEINWKNKTISINIGAFIKNSKAAEDSELLFTGVSFFEMPHFSPWGNSHYINSVNVKDDFYFVEMQSGDIIKIRADELEFNVIY